MRAQGNDLLSTTLNVAVIPADVRHEVSVSLSASTSSIHGMEVKYRDTPV